jgi:hypothetical protein
MNWQPIAPDEFDNPEVQEETRRKLIRDFSVDKLRMNMEVNGYLPIDRVIVREFKPSKYVVLEGNRRICAAKLISSLTAEGAEVQEEALHGHKDSVRDGLSVSGD